MKVLITNPEIDGFTRYLLAWSRRLIKEMSSRHDFFHLDKSKSTRRRFEGMIRKVSPDLILLNGHGTESYVLGHNNESLVDLNNVDLLSGKTIHAMSCHSARKLGPVAVAHGAKAYLGYDQPFFASRMDDKISNPLEDTTAALFLDPAFTAQKALIGGKAPSEAVALAKKEFNRSIVKALTSPVQSDNDQFVGLLLWDRDHLVSIE